MCPDDLSYGVMFREARVLKEKFYPRFTSVAKRVPIPKEYGGGCSGGPDPTTVAETPLGLWLLPLGTPAGVSLGLICCSAR